MYWVQVRAEPPSTHFLSRVFFSCSQIIKTVLQPKPVNTDTKETTESVGMTLER